MARTSTASRTSARRHASTKHTQTQVPLGSLTQPGARSGASCRACGSERVTRLAMNLTDGSPVEFTSCHRCEHRTWVEQDSAAVLPVARVLDKTRKI
jgi:DNA-directed RNA polymerase subunit M/transcription elongation factor TFIIS